MKIIFGLILSVCFVICGYGQSGRKNNAPPSQNSEQKADRPLEIIEKEPPGADVAAYCFRHYGTPYVKTAVRVTFDKTGVISAVEIYAPSECREFDEESLKVAGRIKFKPAIKNGEPVTVTKLVVYQGGMR